MSLVVVLRYILSQHLRHPQMTLVVLGWNLSQYLRQPQSHCVLNHHNMRQDPDRSSNLHKSRPVSGIYQVWWVGPVAWIWNGPPRMGLDPSESVRGLNRHVMA